MLTQERTYRTHMARGQLATFRVVVRETDLLVLAARDLSDLTLDLICQLRYQLERYIAGHPDFLHTLSPWPSDPFAPLIVKEMIVAAASVGVGPMAAVAGAVAEQVGLALKAQSPEVIIENGGDIFLAVQGRATVAIYAGNSPLSHRVGIQVEASANPLGICTSSGTVGHSFSRGQADAACVLAPSVALADAAATALGNRVPDAQAIPAALDWAAQVPGLLGAVIIVGDKLGAWGEVELVPLRA
ncbi:MAG: UPF0280 family protein [Deltaproteobacteria bacterium]|nr:UPF0280 family protein [Deltaproteobacteria bacterium]MBW1951900.1 UPF0280 family protein [Deltaproteobacteria bacterium]MBW1986958.1 UPF0280 family protein [Deltaproteobacteria bacterium]MBW2134473.1 UPF0280 family protein [Deltaproteobacteria bacterium]